MIQSAASGKAHSLCRRPSTATCDLQPRAAVEPRSVSVAVCTVPSLFTKSFLLHFIFLPSRPWVSSTASRQPEEASHSTPALDMTLWRLPGKQPGRPHRKYCCLPSSARFTSSAETTKLTNCSSQAEALPCRTLGLAASYHRGQGHKRKAERVLHPLCHPCFDVSFPRRAGQWKDEGDL